jgi:hypothetical protein
MASWGEGDRGRGTGRDRRAHAPTAAHADRVAAQPWTATLLRPSGFGTWLAAAFAHEIEQRRLFPWIAVAFGIGILLEARLTVRSRRRLRSRLPPWPARPRSGGAATSLRWRSRSPSRPCFSDSPRPC